MPPPSSSWACDGSPSSVSPGAGVQPAARADHRQAATDREIWYLFPDGRAVEGIPSAPGERVTR
jgi:hypothetical protein